MGAYGTLLLAGLLALVGFAMLLVVPGVGILAGLLLAAGIVWAAVIGISAAGRGRAQSDTEDRRDEHEARRRAR